MKLSMTRVLTAVVLVSAVPSFAASIAVPNGNFTNTANNGQIGGGLLNTSGSAQIGSGPWGGTYNAVLGLLAPPLLSIDDDPTNGMATISGILGGTNLLGDTLDNDGWFQQTLPTTTYAANTVYTLTADVDAGAVLNVNALDNFGAGIALLNGSNVTASSADPTALVGLTLLSGSQYELSLQFTTGSTAPTGNLGVRLFDDPDGLATAALLQQVSFSNVTLDASPAGAAAPEPGAFVLAGIGLLAMARVRIRRRG